MKRDGAYNLLLIFQVNSCIGNMLNEKNVDVSLFLQLYLDECLSLIINPSHYTSCKYH